MGKKYTPETAQNFFDKYNCFELLNFTGNEINKYYQEWQNSNHVFFNDFLWSLFNKAISINGKNFSSTGNEKEFYFINSIIYYNMSDFRREEGASKTVINKLLSLAEESRLNEIKTSSGIKYQVVVIGGKCCDFCDKLNNNRYDFTDYILNPRLDKKKCTNERGCSCTTSVVPMRDKNGKLMRE